MDRLTKAEFRQKSNRLLLRLVPDGIERLLTNEGDVERRITVQSSAVFAARSVTGALWAVAILVGGLIAWAARHSMTNDGIQYLDMGDAYWRGDWRMAINAYWSPLFAWLLGLSMRLLKPTPYWEYAVAHLANFVVYVATLGCFEFFMRSLLRYRRQRSCSDANDGAPGGLPEWALRALGYSWFMWSSVVLANAPIYVTPDMCVAALFYLATGVLLRIRTAKARLLDFISLGAVLGVGYLAKTAMFPLSFVFLIASVFAAGNRSRAAKALMAFAVFVAIAGPFVTALSLAKGRFTVGDAGKLTYMRLVSRMPDRHWQGVPPEGGVPQHPTRKLLAVPPIYEYGSPIGGTYPVAYDPSYWWEGAIAKVTLKREVEIVIKHVRNYFRIFLDRGEIPMGLFILLYLGGRGRLAARDISPYGYLLIPALAGLLMYALVYVEGRYIAPFVVTLCLGLYAGVRLPDSREARRLVTCVTMSVVAMAMLAIGPNVLAAAKVTVRNLVSGEAAMPSKDWEIADTLHRMGVHEGAKLASLEYPNRSKTHWARLARVRFVAELYDEEGCDADCTSAPPYQHAFWVADDALKNRILQAFRNAGADFIVTDTVPRFAATDGWRQVGSTGTFLFPLQKSRAALGEGRSQPH